MQKSSFYFLLKILGVFILVLAAMTAFAVFSPRTFAPNTQVHIAKNSSLSAIADALEKKHVVSSAFLFKVVVVMLRGQGKIAAGDYVFNDPENIKTVATRLMQGDQGLTAIKVTIPEGTTVQDVALILLRRIPDFSAPYFLKIASTSEGHLFPDTYFFYPNTTPGEILAALRKNFDTKFESLALDVSLSGHTPDEIITMASLLEREATSTRDRAIIAGILWKRIAEEMPLQVDASIVYVTGRAPVTIDDTKINSPYNTYKNKGLPKGPISSPSLDALRAATDPVKTPYYYYLSDRKGVTHYASTFEGHQVNREKYLNK